MSNGVISANQSAKKFVDDIEKLNPASISQPSCTPTDKFSGYHSMRAALLECQGQEFICSLEAKLQQLLLHVSWLLHTVTALQLSADHCQSSATMICNMIRA